MENSNAGFVATFLYSYLILYLVWAVVKGNVKFGIRIPGIIRFYPMKPNETWMNSFLFNIIMLLIASTGITQLATSCFPTYTRNTAIYNMYGLQVNYMRFYRYLYQYKVFGIALVAWSLVTLIYLLFTCNRPPKYQQEIEKIRK
jgi:LMBR1 domain-containing protein 1